MGDGCSKVEEPADNNSFVVDLPHRSFVDVEPTIVELPPQKKRRRKSRLSLFRVNSHRSRDSPERASNYNHVHDAVAKTLRMPANTVPPIEDFRWEFQGFVILATRVS